MSSSPERFGITSILNSKMELLSRGIAILFGQIFSFFSAPDRSGHPISSGIHAVQLQATTNLSLWYSTEWWDLEKKSLMISPNRSRQQFSVLLLKSLQSRWRLLAPRPQS